MVERSVTDVQTDYMSVSASFNLSRNDQIRVQHMLDAVVLSPAVGKNPGFDIRPSRAAGDTQVVIGLEVEPEFRRHAKKFPQSERRVRRDGSFSTHDGADAPRRYEDFTRHAVDADPIGLHEIFP